MSIFYNKGSLYKWCSPGAVGARRGEAERSGAEQSGAEPLVITPFLIPRQAPGFTHIHTHGNIL